MCGIVGYVGQNQAAPILLDGLSKLEYRGYDSAGIAVRSGEKEVAVIKAKGRLKALFEKTNDGKSVKGNCGIGHTRWATHGEPSEINAHPHISDDRCVVGVHNGIIENYQELRNKLIRKGYHFYSETDTEVVVKLVDYYYKKYKVGPIDAIAKTMVRVRGSYALVIMFQDYPGELYCARKDSPMILGKAEDGNYIASDVPAILKYSRNVYYIENLEMARLTGDEIQIYNLDGEVVDREFQQIEMDASAAEKGGYEHFMMKEIHEQPEAVRKTLNSVLKTDPEGKEPDRIDFSEIGLTDEEIAGFDQIHIVACGSAYHTGVVGQYVFEDLAEIPVRVDVASEFRYRKLLLSEKTLVIVVSQSGETADTLAALREAKNHGVRTLAIVNVVGSSIAREADYVFYTLAGPEIAVATTKAYSAQLIAQYTLAMKFAQVRGKLPDEKFRSMTEELKSLPAKIERTLEDKERLQWFTSKFSNEKDVFFIGRGIDYAICLEGSLKMKEISYTHSEAYPAGELKHGTISLIEKGMLSISLATQDDLYEKTLSNMVEIKARGGYTMGITHYGKYEIEDQADFVVYIPQTDAHFMASLAVVPLQLMGYYMSCARGLDVDKPRNLAKSVTVE